MAFNEELGYHDETEALIERMCKNVERGEFRLQKKKAEEAILKTYDLFDLPRPKKITWHKDIFDKEYRDAAGSAGSAWSAWSAWSAGSAGSAWSAGSAGSAGSAWSAWSAGSAGSAGSAWSAGSAGSAGSAWSAGSALDYDFDYYVMEHQYILDPTDNQPNANDHKYLEYCELLMEAKEYGAGYRVEYNDTLHIVPTPLVHIDKQSRWHSDEVPSIRWKGGEEFYYLCGVHFEKKLWRRVTSGGLTAKELAEIEDVDQRKIAMTFLTGDDFIREMKAELVDEGITVFYEHLANRRIAKRTNTAGEKGYEVTSRLYKVPEGDVYDEDKYFLKYTNPSTGEEHISFVTNFVKEVGENADACMARKHNTTVEEFKAGGGA